MCRIGHSKNPYGNLLHELLRRSFEVGTRRQSKEAFMRRFAFLFFAMTMAISVSISAGAVEQLSTDVNDQIALEMTVYNSNIGLVKDRRQIKLDKGIQELRFMDVAAQIIPTSVNIKPLGGQGGFTILEQNYEYDLLSPGKLLDKYVGRELKLYSKKPLHGQGRDCNSDTSLKQRGAARLQNRQRDNL